MSRDQLAIVCYDGATICYLGGIKVSIYFTSRTTVVTEVSTEVSAGVSGDTNSTRRKTVQCLHLTTRVYFVPQVSAEPPQV